LSHCLRPKLPDQSYNLPVFQGRTYNKKKRVEESPIALPKTKMRFFKAVRKCVEKRRFKNLVRALRKQNLAQLPVLKRHRQMNKGIFFDTTLAR
jgi:hypothetical protein